MTDFFRLHQAAEQLKPKIGGSRYFHSLGVMQTALVMADLFGVEPGKAAWAGLLHDCARELNDSELGELIAENVVEIPEESRPFPFLYHNFAGAALARRDYGLDCEETLAAIRTHTCGDAGMTLLQKIIYIADLIEPARAIGGAEIKMIRGAAYADLDWAFRLTADFKMQAGSEKLCESPPPAVRLRAELEFEQAR